MGYAFREKHVVRRFLIKALKSHLVTGLCIVILFVTIVIGVGTRNSGCCYISRISGSSIEFYASIDENPDIGDQFFVLDETVTTKGGEKAGGKRIGVVTLTEVLDHSEARYRGEISHILLGH